MATFRVGFVSAKTGKRNNRTIKAFDDFEARERFKGEAVEGSLVAQMIPPEPATEAQLDYLTVLGAVIPAGLSKDEAIDFIDATLRKQSPATEEELERAAYFRVTITRYASKGMVFERIFQRLFHGEDWHGLTVWFVWRVCRDMFYHSGQIPEVELTDPKVSTVAEMLMADREWQPALKRSSNKSVCMFRWFGAYKGNQGESRKTRAYQMAQGAIVKGELEISDSSSD
ncbi:hypothetical protein [Agrobacterium vitis]|uniref:Uncharacterized protein n=1 Tax=Agrobacterium vitis TaxID=373 RepID=A0AAE2UUS7_AGRVI|nr:hypothetical protein [Agrobacterium vitis]MBF2715696.1 hypothetical protein [Agrobacterium vitis]